VVRSSQQQRSLCAFFSSRLTFPHNGNGNQIKQKKAKKTKYTRKTHKIITQSRTSKIINSLIQIITNNNSNKKKTNTQNGNA